MIHSDQNIFKNIFKIFPKIFQNILKYSGWISIFWCIKSQKWLSLSLSLTKWVLFWCFFLCENVPSIWEGMHIVPSVDYNKFPIRLYSYVLRMYAHVLRMYQAMLCIQVVQVDIWQNTTESYMFIIRSTQVSHKIVLGCTQIVLVCTQNGLGMYLDCTTLCTQAVQVDIWQNKTDYCPYNSRISAVFYIATLQSTILYPKCTQQYNILLE